MDNLFFQDKNQLFRVLLNVKTYEQMLIYCTKSNPYETGGILIGNYSPDHITANIAQITPSPKNSQHSKSNFYRGTDGLQEILDSVWNRGLYYIGEWHYHPNSASIPSYVDKKQMMLLSNNMKLKCPEPILIIVGGCNNSWSINVSVYYNNSEIPLLLKLD